MDRRKCPFCLSNSSRSIGVRVDPWVKCRDCRSIFRDITPARFNQIHGEAFQDDEYIDTSNAFAGDQPLSSLWDLLSLPGASVLEIGPGAGHLLAAARQAGRSVAAVESSEVHRDFIRDTWGISSLYADVDEIPGDRTFDAIMAINVFEHIYDIGDFLRAMKKSLAPGGTLFLSTSNAASLEAIVLKSWWSMCKVHDHVSFPSPAGMAVAARSNGLRVERIWSTGLPFEFPVSAMTSARDIVLASRGRRNAAAPGEDRVPAVPVGPGAINPDIRARLVRFYSAAAPFDPTARLLATLGRASSVKARLTC